VTTPISALERARYINLETFKRDGNGVKTPVWSARAKSGATDALYVFTDGTSFKVKRVGRNPKARVAECNVSGAKIIGPWYDAKAELLDGGPEEAAAYAALRAKYGIQMWLLDVGSKLGGRYGRRKVIRLTFPGASA
jgi:PPOX class probable F420-dependent enzyme